MLIAGEYHAIRSRPNLRWNLSRYRRVSIAFIWATIESEWWLSSLIKMMIRKQRWIAVIIGKRNATFLRRVYDSYQSFHPNCWDCHSVRHTGELALIYPNEVLVLSSINFFRPSWTERQLFFQSNDFNFTSNYASHLWNKVHYDELSKLTVNKILTGNFTLARMIRHAIGRDKLEKLQKLTDRTLPMHWNESRIAFCFRFIFSVSLYFVWVYMIFYTREEEEKNRQRRKKRAREKTDASDSIVDISGVHLLVIEWEFYVYMYGQICPLRSDELTEVDIKEVIAARCMFTIRDRERERKRNCKNTHTRRDRRGRRK